MIINSYLHFDGNATEVMNYYKECLGAELFIMKIGDSPIAQQCPAGMQDQVMHATLSKDGNVLIMASDMVAPGFPFVKGNNYALSVSCNSEEEIHSLFEKLKEGGHIIDALKPQFWGAIFGVVNDKYGIRWMLNFDTSKR